MGSATSNALDGGVAPQPSPCPVFYNYMPRSSVVPEIALPTLGASGAVRRLQRGFASHITQICPVPSSPFAQPPSPLPASTRLASSSQPQASSFTSAAASAAATPMSFSSRLSEGVSPRPPPIIITSPASSQLLPGVTPLSSSTLSSSHNNSSSSVVGGTTQPQTPKGVVVALSEASTPRAAPQQPQPLLASFRQQRPPHMALSACYLIAYEVSEEGRLAPAFTERNNTVSPLRRAQGQTAAAQQLQQVGIGFNLSSNVATAPASMRVSCLSERAMCGFSGRDGSHPDSCPSPPFSPFSGSSNNQRLHQLSGEGGNSATAAPSSPAPPLPSTSLLPNSIPSGINVCASPRKTTFARVDPVLATPADSFTSVKTPHSVLIRDSTLTMERESPSVRSRSSRRFTKLCVSHRTRYCFFNDSRTHEAHVTFTFCHLDQAAAIIGTVTAATSAATCSSEAARSQSTSNQRQQSPSSQSQPQITKLLCQPTQRAKSLRPVEEGGTSSESTSLFSPLATAYVEISSLVRVQDFLQLLHVDSARPAALSAVSNSGGGTTAVTTTTTVLPQILPPSADVEREDMNRKISENLSKGHVVQVFLVLAPGTSISVVESASIKAYHISTTFVPFSSKRSLATSTPGRSLTNSAIRAAKERVRTLVKNTYKHSLMWVSSDIIVDPQQQGEDMLSMSLGAVRGAHNHLTPVALADAPQVQASVTTRVDVSEGGLPSQALNGDGHHRKSDCEDRKETGDVDNASCDTLSRADVDTAGYQSDVEGGEDENDGCFSSLASPDGGPAQETTCWDDENVDGGAVLPPAIRVLSALRRNRGSDTSSSGDSDGGDDGSPTMIRSDCSNSDCSCTSIASCSSSLPLLNDYQRTSSPTKAGNRAPATTHRQPRPQTPSAEPVGKPSPRQMISGKATQCSLSKNQTKILKPDDHIDRQNRISSSSSETAKQSMGISDENETDDDGMEDVHYVPVRPSQAYTQTRRQQRPQRVVNRIETLLQFGDTSNALFRRSKPIQLTH